MPKATNGHIGARAKHSGLPKRDQILLFRNMAFDVVEPLMLDKNHGILVSQSGLDQPLHVVGRGRNSYLQAWDMSKERPKGVGMMRAGAANTTTRRAQHEGYFEPAVRDVVDGGGLLHNLSHGLQGEIHEHDVHDGMTARQRRSDAKSRLRAFRDGCVADPRFAEFSPEAAALLEVTASWPNALSYIKDVGIAPHLFANAFHAGLGVGDDALGLPRKVRPQVELLASFQTFRSLASISIYVA